MGPELALVVIGAIAAFVIGSMMMGRRWDKRLKGPRHNTRRDPDRDPFEETGRYDEAEVKRRNIQQVDDPPTRRDRDPDTDHDGGDD